MPGAVLSSSYGSSNLILTTAFHVGSKQDPWKENRNHLCVHPYSPFKSPMRVVSP